MGTTQAAIPPATAVADGDAAGDSLWRSAPLLVVLLVVAAGALLPSFVAVREYAAHVGAHRQLIWGAPLCLDGLALSAAYAWIDRHTRGLPAGSAPWSAVGAALATLAVNALHANPDLLDPVVGLVALSLLAPIAAFAAFHLVFESLTQHRTSRFARNTAAERETRHATPRNAAQSAPAAVALRSCASAEDRAADHCAPSRNRLRDTAHAQADTQPVARGVTRETAAHDSTQPDAQPDRTHARVTRTVATRQTTVTEVIDVVTDDTVRAIVADWLAGGGDLHDPALTTRVERALGKSRRTAQLHLQPARQAAADASSATPRPPASR